MMAEWQDRKLGEVLTLQRGFDLPVQNRIQGSVPVIASTGEVGRHSESMVGGPGVVIGRSGSLGGAQYIPHDFWPLNTTLWVKDFKGNHPRFCYYLLKSLNLERFNAGTTVPTLNRNHIYSLSVRLPSIYQQEAIAELLGALDDKISVNRQMNRTLEAMAQTIFKSWFVDFDPVVSKAAGRQPFGMDTETAALFPNGFVSTDKGSLPSGWHVARLGEMIEINARTLDSKYPHHTIEYIDISSVTRGRVETSTHLALAAAPSRARRLVTSGDTIWSCVRPNRMSYLYIDAPPDNLVVSTGFAVLTPGTVPPAFLYQYVTTDEFVDYLTANAEGSAYPAVRPEVFARAECVLPAKGVLEAFSRLVDPIRARIGENEREVRTLTALRDTLLPKLISGEIRLNHAERVVGGTV